MAIIDGLSGVLFRVFRSGTRVQLENTSVWMYQPENAAVQGRGPAVLWLHGGGMIVGDARQDEGRNQVMADTLGVPVVSVQYRNSKNHSFPAGLDDCMEALEWLAAREDVDPELIVVMGASGGGGLAAQAVQRAVAEGRVTPCAQVLIYPMLDDRSSDAEHPHDSAYRTWDTQSNRLAWGRYLKGHDRSAPPPFAVPARTSSLEGLPPTWIGVGTLDLFHDEDVEYAKRLEEAGVETELVVLDGAFHGFGFDVAGADTPQAKAFLASQMNMVQARWAELGWTKDQASE